MIFRWPCTQEFPLFPHQTHPRSGTEPVSPVVFSHPAAQPAAGDMVEADLNGTRQVSFSAAPTSTSVARRRP